MAAKRWDEIIARIGGLGGARVAEVGVWRGKTSEKVLAACPWAHLTLVDPWRAGEPGDSWHDSGSRMARQPQAEVDKILAGVQAMAKRYSPRVTIVRALSTIAAAEQPDGHFDLVFLDGDHSQLAVLADIQAWLPKVREGGWIGGHDFGSERFPGVRSAVLMHWDLERVELGANATWWVRV